MADIERSDGRGDPIDDDAVYYVQDIRQHVGNCILWWGKDRAGYVCSLDEAGRYLGREVRGLRATDVPWPAEYVERHVVRHVRGDGSAFSRDRYRSGPR